MAERKIITANSKHLVVPGIALLLLITVIISPTLPVTAQDSQYQAEWDIDIVTDILSLQKAHEVWKMTVKLNYGLWSWLQFRMWDDTRYMQFTRVYDDEGDVKFEHLVGPPIPPGEPKDVNLKIYPGRVISSGGQPYSFTMEFDRFNNTDNYDWYTGCKFQFIRKIRIKVILPAGYINYRNMGARSIENYREVIERTVENQTDLVSVGVFLGKNSPPRALILLSSKQAKTGTPITFRGYSLKKNIIGYNWSSSIDGPIGSSDVFTRADLSPGTHVITLKVQDDLGAWSDAASETLLIGNNLLESKSPQTPGDRDNAGQSNFLTMVIVFISISVCGLGALAAILIVVRRKHKSGLLTASQDNEEKMIRWEAEGYDLQEIRKKIQK